VRRLLLLQFQLLLQLLRQEGMGVMVEALLQMVAGDMGVPLRIAVGGMDEHREAHDLKIFRGSKLGGWRRMESRRVLQRGFLIMICA
jgi:hypothetical protein